MWKLYMLELAAIYYLYSRWEDLCMLERVRHTFDLRPVRNITCCVVHSAQDARRISVSLFLLQQNENIQVPICETF